MEAKMTTEKIEAPVPFAPHPDTLADNRMTILSADKSRLICYCPRNHCGAVLHVQLGLWAIYTPMSFREFFNTLGQRGISLPQGPDYETWIQAIALAAAGEVAH